MSTVLKYRTVPNMNYKIVQGHRSIWDKSGLEIIIQKTVFFRAAQI